MKRFIVLVLMVIIASGSAYAASESPESRILADLKKMGTTNVILDMNVRIDIPLIPECPGHSPITLMATLIRPGGEVKPRPTILIATAYRREDTIADGYGLVEHGYNVLCVDDRGSGSSPDVWKSFDLPEQYDTAYIIDHWIPAQTKWANGKSGMIGSSYCGIIELLAAGLCDVDPSTGEPEHLKAIFPYVPMSDPYRTIAMHGGNFEEEFMLLWLGGTNIFAVMPPLVDKTGDMTDAELLKLKLELWNTHFKHISTCISWIRDPKHDSFCDFYKLKSAMLYWPEKPAGGWKYDDGSVLKEGDRTLPVKLPIFMVGGWFDIFTRSTLETYEYGLKDHPKGNKAVIVGPWYHEGGSGGVGVKGLMESRDIQARFFDWKIKGINDPFLTDFPVLLYVMGEEKWRAEKTWPLAESRSEPRKLYLSKQKASTISGDWYTDPKSLKNNNKNNFALSFVDSIWNFKGDTPVMKHTPLTIHGMNSRSMTRWMGGMASVGTESDQLVNGKDNSTLDTEDERDDERGVLTFTTEPLDRDIEIVGPLLLKFWASTKFDRNQARNAVEGSVKMIKELFDIDEGLILDNLCKDDVQWVAEINDVFEDGRARNITSGWLSAWMRPYDPANPTEPDPDYTPFDPFYIATLDHPDRDKIKEDVTYCYVMEIWPTCNVFKKGHRIRLSLSGSDFPHMLPILIPSTSALVLDEDHPASVEFETTNGNDEGDSWKWIRQGPSNSGFNKYLTSIQNEFDAVNSYLLGLSPESDKPSPEEEPVDNDHGGSNPVVGADPLTDSGSDSSTFCFMHAASGII